MIKLHNFQLTYPDGTKAVQNLSFSISKGEKAALVGANGAGKTSLLLALVGVLPAAGGTAALDGLTFEKSNIPEIRRRVGLVFQNPDDQLFMPQISDDIAFGPRNLGLPESEVEQRVAESLAYLGIPHLRARSPLKLSGGEKRAASIATVLAMRPSVLLLDEPTAFLDPRARRGLINLLRGLPHTMLVATHDLAFAAQVCQRVILLKEGTVYADGMADTLLYDERLMDGCGVESLCR